MKRLGDSLPGQIYFVSGTQLLMSPSRIATLCACNGKCPTVRPAVRAGSCRTGWGNANISKLVSAPTDVVRNSTDPYWSKHRDLPPVYLLKYEAKYRSHEFVDSLKPSHAPGGGLGGASLARCAREDWPEGCDQSFSVFHRAGHQLRRIGGASQAMRVCIICYCDVPSWWTTEMFACWQTVRGSLES